MSSSTEFYEIPGVQEETIFSFREAYLNIYFIDVQIFALR